LPHVPQLDALVWSDTHWLPHSVSPVPGHAHAPLLQVSTEGQTTPQPPQLFASVRSLTHACSAAQ
jgi:hypothetical protein